MAEQQVYATTHCEPCEECVQEDWQFVRDGELYWAGYGHCPRYEVYACDDGRGVPPPWVRERIVALEGTVHLPVGGPGGVPIALLRRVYGLSIAEVVAARKTGYRATPVEARYLTELLSAGAEAAGPG
ncbi:hypothetical protein KPP03845_104813 [Streptomyces xanthophaeus]|uniref:hypothetical protein n=1 Tax=Streptomyces xanthophaeus TaxID=67385 RepID=UPI00233EF599|nr:hypothetical protein [Streptomyces xanthophaeus]WCD88406.1 hypothetical protein KPP03845_104813 [Streptomyces xanthophaeus]